MRLLFNSKYFLLIILGGFFNSADAARLSCNTTLNGDEVIIAAETNLQFCPSTTTQYTIESIASLPFNEFSEKRVCDGFRLPASYTVKRRELSNVCGSRKDAFLVVNKAPTLRGYRYTTPVNTAITASAATTDLDGDTLTYSSPGYNRSFDGGRVDVNASTGQFTYTPPSSTYSAEDFFTVPVTDGKSDPVYIQVYVQVGNGGTGGNNPPVFQIYEIVADYNRAVNFYVSASDPDGDFVTIALDQTKLPLHGTVVRNVAGTNVYYTYTPASGYLGADRIGFIADDGKGGKGSAEYPVIVKVIDNDGDGIPAWYENTNGLNDYNSADAAQDPDQDGLSNLREFLAGTKLNLADTDGDAIPDGYEVNQGRFNPLQADAHLDFDGDGFTNLDEYIAKTNPNNAGDTPVMPMAAWLIPVLSLLR